MKEIEDEKHFLKGLMLIVILISIFTVGLTTGGKKQVEISSLGMALANSELTLGTVADDGKTRKEVDLGIARDLGFSIDTNFRRAAMAVGDVDGDGKTDLLYLGKKGVHNHQTDTVYLISNFNDKLNQINGLTLGEPGLDYGRKIAEVELGIAEDLGFSIDTNFRRAAMAVGDVDGDGKTDLMYLGRKPTSGSEKPPTVYLISDFYDKLSQINGLKLGITEVEFGVAEDLGFSIDTNFRRAAMDVGDVDGDGKTDLMYLGKKGVHNHQTDTVYIADLNKLFYRKEKLESLNIDLNQFVVYYPDTSIRVKKAQRILSTLYNNQWEEKRRLVILLVTKVRLSSDELTHFMRQLYKKAKIDSKTKLFKREDYTIIVYSEQDDELNFKNYYGYIDKEILEATREKVFERANTIDIFDKSALLDLYVEAFVASI